MDKEIVVRLHSSFEDMVRKHPESGVESWCARDLQMLLGYTQWKNFAKVVDKAITACQNSGYDPKDHFAGISRMVDLGSGARREVEDIALTRYACYLTIDSFNKASNVIRQSTDRLQGETPIHLVQAARPILILDEPQNMESEKSIAALAALDPLLALHPPQAPAQAVTPPAAGAPSGGPTGGSTQHPRREEGRPSPPQRPGTCQGPGQRLRRLPPLRHRRLPSRPGEACQVTCPTHPERAVKVFPLAETDV
jgi:hypothetical protein